MDVSTRASVPPPAHRVPAHRPAGALRAGRHRAGTAAAVGVTVCALAAGVLAGPSASAVPRADAATDAGTGTAAGTAVAGTTMGGWPVPGTFGVGDQLYPSLGNGGYQVRHYDLSLRYATSAPSQPLEGTVTMTAVATQALSRFHVDFAGDAVGAVAVNGRPARFARYGEELIVTPILPLLRGPFTVTVSRFRSTPVVPGQGTSAIGAAFIQTSDGSAWAGQPDGAHRIFPCNDHPSDKATFSFTVDVPAGTTAMANGTLVRRNTRAGRTIWQYEQREPMATELAQVAVGALTITARPTTSGVALRDLTPSRLTAELAPKLAHVTDHLTWLEGKVGDYPFASYGSLVVDAGLPFALETQTLSLYDTNAFATSSSPGVWAPVMVHELAHQWFGNSVAPTRWTDLWQNEGQATWYEFTYAAEKGLLEEYIGYPDIPELMRRLYLLSDRWRLVYGPVGSPRSGKPTDLFNVNVYYGGALVLYALQQKIGDAAFQQVERTWVSKYRGASASTADFVALASAVSGQDLNAFFNDWLYGTTTPPMPGHPDWTTLPETFLAAPADRASADPAPSGRAAPPTDRVDELEARLKALPRR